MTFKRKQYRKRYQEGHRYVEQRADGHHVHAFRWRETQPDGTRKLRKIILGRVDEMKPAEVQRAVGILRVQINRDVPNSANGLMTVQQLADHFLATEIRDGERTQATKDGYHGNLKNWILPRWGSTRICDVRTITFKNWLRTLTGLAPGSKAKIRNHMHAIFNHAIEYQWLTGNPISSVKTSSKRLRLPERLDGREIQLILDRLSGLERLLVVLDAGTGLRVSELLALKWEDVDFKNLQINVRHSIVHQVLGDCKTETSRNPVPLHKYLAEELWRWKLLTPYNQPSDWIAASPRMNGTQPFWPEGLREHIAAAAQKAGIKKSVGWHTFRHSFAMILVANGVHIKITQELLRHQNIRMTMEMYAQAPENQKREAQSGVVHTFRHKGGTKSPLRKHRPNLWNEES
jgi:integrase